MAQGSDGRKKIPSSSNGDLNRSSVTAAATASKRSRTKKTNNRVGGRGEKDGNSAAKTGKKNGRAVRRPPGASIKKRRVARPKTSSKKVPGILGIPVAADADDSDYDDSEDSDYDDSENESYSPSSNGNSSPQGGSAATRYSQASLVPSTVHLALLLPTRRTGARNMSNV